MINFTAIQERANEERLAAREVTEAAAKQDAAFIASLANERAQIIDLKTQTLQLEISSEEISQTSERFQELATKYNTLIGTPYWAMTNRFNEVFVEELAGDNDLLPKFKVATTESGRCYIEIVLKP